MERSIRSSLLRAVIALTLMVFAACGSDEKRDRAGGAAATVPADPPASPAPANSGGTRAAARWETVVTLTGSGPTRTQAFTILAGAIQWRARFSCEGGALRVTTDPPPRRPAAVVDASCPTQGEGFSIVIGAVSLVVEATSAWRLIIDQQVDTPLDEPPLPAMATAPVLGQGPFYDIEKDSKGTARLFRLPDGTHALRMENFEVNQNTDLFVWLDTAVAPKTSRDAQSAEYWVLGNLKSTVGNQNYLIPADVPINRVNSIVIWCDPVAIAYAAAALRS